MSLQITTYDNRGTALNVNHLRVAREWRVETEQPLHPVWIFVAIAIGLALGNWLFG